MIKSSLQESARQKKIAAHLSKIHLEDIEDATKVMLEHIGAMKAWVGQQSIMKNLSDTFVGHKLFVFQVLIDFTRKMMRM